MAKSIRDKTKNASVVKTYLDTPFQLSWPEIGDHGKASIRERIADFTAAHQAPRTERERQAQREQSRKRKRLQQPSAGGGGGAAAAAAAGQAAPEGKGEGEGQGERQGDGDGDGDADADGDGDGAGKGTGKGKGKVKGKKKPPVVRPRRTLVAGINQVAKSLERRELRLVLVCRSVQPAILTDHILTLAHRSGARVCALYDFAALLGPLYGISTAAAVGVRKQPAAAAPGAEVSDCAVCVPPPTTPLGITAGGASLASRSASIVRARVRVRVRVWRRRRRRWRRWWRLRPCSGRRAQRARPTSARRRANFARSPPRMQMCCAVVRARPGTSADGRWWLLGCAWVWLV